MSKRRERLRILPAHTDPTNRADRFTYDYRNRLIKVEHTNNYGDTPVLPSLTHIIQVLSVPQMQGRQAPVCSHTPSAA